MLILALVTAALAAASPLAQPAERVDIERRGWGWSRARSVHRTPPRLQPPPRAAVRCAVDDGSAAAAPGRARAREAASPAGARPTPCTWAHPHVIQVRQTTSSPSSSPSPSSTSSPRPSSTSLRSSSSSTRSSSSSLPPSSSSSRPLSSSSSSPSPSPSTSNEPTTTSESSTTSSAKDTTTTDSSTETSSTSTTASPSASSSAPAADPAPAAVPIGAIIGGAIAGAVVVGALTALLILRLRKRSRRRPRDSHLFMDPDFPIALDPYYPVPGNQSPAPSNLGRNPSTGSLTPLTSRPRRSGYEAYDSVEYVYAGPDGYYDPATGTASSVASAPHPPQRGPSYVQRVPARQPSVSQGYAAYAGPGACLPEGERYDYDGHSHFQHGYPQGYAPSHVGYPAQQGGYPAQAGDYAASVKSQPAGYPQQNGRFAPPPQMQQQMTGGYPQAGYPPDAYPADAYPSDAYPGPAPVAGHAYPSSPARLPTRAPSTSTSISSPVVTAGPPLPIPSQAAAPAQAHVSPSMVVHEEDAGVVLPTTLPPMYRAEWAPAEGTARPAKS